MHLAVLDVIGSNGGSQAHCTKFNMLSVDDVAEGEGKARHSTAGLFPYTDQNSQVDRTVSIFKLKAPRLSFSDGTESSTMRSSTLPFEDTFSTRPVLNRNRGARFIQPDNFQACVQGQMTTKKRLRGEQIIGACAGERGGKDVNALVGLFVL